MRQRVRQFARSACKMERAKNTRENHRAGYGRDGERRKGWAGLARKKVSKLTAKRY